MPCRLFILLLASSWLHLVPPTQGSASLRERSAHLLFAFNSQLDQKASQIKVAFLIAS